MCSNQEKNKNTLKGNFAKKSKIDIMSILYRNAQIYRY